MPLDATNFLISFAAAIAGAMNTAAPSDPITFGQNLFVFQARESGSGNLPPYTTFRPYGGPPPEELEPIDQISIQAMTNCKTTADAFARGRRFYAALYEDVEGNTRPRNSWVIPAKKLDAAENVVDDPAIPNGWDVQLITPSQPPGFIGIDTDERSNVSFNFDLRFGLADPD